MISLADTRRAYLTCWGRIEPYKTNKYILDALS